MCQSYSPKALALNSMHCCGGASTRTTHSMQSRAEPCRACPAVWFDYSELNPYWWTNHPHPQTVVALWHANRTEELLKVLTPLSTPSALSVSLQSCLTFRCQTQKAALWSLKNFYFYLCSLSKRLKKYFWSLHGSELQEYPKKVAK